jgi:hypothetical protein
MSDLDNNQQALFPDLPREQQFLDDNGNITELWSLGLSQLFQTLQSVFRQEGLIIPRLLSTDFDAIVAAYTPYIGGVFPLEVFDPSGMIAYDVNNYVTKQFVITYTVPSNPNEALIIDTVSWKTFAYL